MTKGYLLLAPRDTTAQGCRKGRCRRDVIEWPAMYRDPFVSLSWSVLRVVTSIEQNLCHGALATTDLIPNTQLFVMVVMVTQFTQLALLSVAGFHCL
jgi:hypothetical protein